MRRRDVDEEIQAYMDLLIAEKMKAGMTLDDARRAARLEVGGVEHIKEEVNDARKGALVETTLQDLKYGLRLLKRSPGFAALTAPDFCFSFSPPFGCGCGFPPCLSSGFCCCASFFCEPGSFFPSCC